MSSEMANIKASSRLDRCRCTGTISGGDVRRHRAWQASGGIHSRSALVAPRLRSAWLVN